MRTSSFLEDAEEDWGVMSGMTKDLYCKYLDCLSGTTCRVMYRGYSRSLWLIDSVLIIDDRVIETGVKE